ncbi:MAG TPA: type II secretion system F family protein [Dehalococcoidia bacterium]|nr:type II secretion system F family protein [Dehalococcoidia bacterium]
MSATSEAAAVELLGYSGYQVVNLSEIRRRLDVSWLTRRFTRIKPTEIILFYRQLALLLNSGIDIVKALELLQIQTSSRRLAMALGDVIAELQGGSRLSAALSKHPELFTKTSCRLLQIGEESGSFETTLKHLADYLEKEAVAAKGIKNALMYPAVALVVTVIVIGILITFVLPAFGELYSNLGTELPMMAKIFIGAGDFFRSAAVYMLLILIIAIAGAVAYIRTPGGRYWLNNLSLRLPLIGRIVHLKELARSCRSISLLFYAGLPMPEIIRLTSQASNNMVINEAFSNVEEDMLKGEGLSHPMEKNPIFLPLMVQMVRIGEETGELDINLEAVAQNYEVEAEDKTRSVIGLLQPTLTIIIGLVIGLIALSLTSAMYSVYGQGI